jgi:hypothetical protein
MDPDGLKFDWPPVQLGGFLFFRGLANNNEEERGMTRGGRGVHRHMKGKRQSVGDQAGAHHKAPRTSQEFARRLTLQSGPALVRLKHECEKGTLPASSFIWLLEHTLSQPPEAEKGPSEHGSILYYKHGRPLRRPSQTVKAPQTSRDTARALTLDNPRVRTRLEHEWKRGTLHPSVRKWLMAHGYERKDMTQSQKKQLDFVTLSGLPPWENDPMAQQETDALDAQKDQEKTEKLARQSSAEKAQGSAGEDHDAEDQDVPELVRETDYDAWGRRTAPRAGQPNKL